MVVNKKNRRVILDWILAGATPAILFYLLEWMTHNPWKTMLVPIQLYNILFFEMIFGLLLAVFGKASVALITEISITYGYGLLNYYVMQFRSKPIVPWDIYSVKTAASVADNYSYRLSVPVMVVTFLMLCLLILSWHNAICISGKWLGRCGLLLLSVGLLWGYVRLLHWNSFIWKLGYYDKQFTPDTMSYKDGTVDAFLIDLQFLKVNKPDGYSKEKVEDLLQSTAESEKAENCLEEPMNLIVIMDEAFSDLAVLGELQTNRDYMPYIHSLLQGEENTVGGDLQVSVLGGNTANTEFEFLTGNTMAFLPDGSIPYQQYLRGEMPSLASVLAQNGFATVAVHPYGGGGWNRNQVYPWLGFEKVLFQDSFVNPERIRKYVSDAECVRTIENLIENKKPDTSLFVFTVTMQNHGSYREAFTNFREEVTTGDEDAEQLNRYLSLLLKTDRAIEELIEYCNSLSEKTVVVFFGDHQPNDSVSQYVYLHNGDSIQNHTDKRNQYRVPFFIWSNYDIEEKQAVKLSANYLGAYVLELLHLPKNDYQRYLCSLAKNYPIVSTQVMEKQDGGEAFLQDEAIRDYQAVQYYCLFEKQKKNEKE